MNRDELIEQIIDVASKVRWPDPYLTTESFYPVADFVLALIEQERRTAQVEVLRAMGDEFREMDALRRPSIHASYVWGACEQRAQQIEKVDE
jgi:hypothetical protein